MQNSNTPARRAFLAQLGAATAMLAGGAAGAPLAAQLPEPATDADSDRQQASPWDTSWIDRLANVPYRVVFDANTINDGITIDLAAGFLDQFHEAHGTTDAQTRAVIVMRQLGTPMALGDGLWDKYAIGEELKLNDPATKQPARRNPYYKALPGSWQESHSDSLQALTARGTILLLCNIAMHNWSSRHAEAAKRSVDEVVTEVRAGLVPGTIVVPSGIYALIRAQNAGCAYMHG
jgi:intracellular sulfur oxidation DsrE/DsrF family protein